MRESTFYVLAPLAKIGFTAYMSSVQNNHGQRGGALVNPCRLENY